MKAIIRPCNINGTVKAPPSKSMAHRLLIAAGLSQGVSMVRNVSLSEDIKATINSLQALGATISEVQSDAEGAEYSTFEIQGTDPMRISPSEIDCNESGSTLRFMIPIVAMSESEIIMRGSAGLMQRPLSVYEDIFRSQTLVFEKSPSEIKVRGKLKGGDYSIPGDISSQFASGLIMALPLADASSTLELTGKIESRPYIDMSISALREFGVNAEWIDERTIYIAGGQRYTEGDVTVEGDWSNAAYLMATGIDVADVDDDSLQGDKVCRKHFKILSEEFAEIDIKDCPDLGPVLMAYAAMNKGCMLRNTNRLKIKESDRGRAMREELGKFGTGCEIGDNFIKVDGGISKPNELLCAHNDHRIAMALTALCINTGGTIEGAECVNKSYPDFFERIKAVGADIDLEDIA